MNFAWDPPKRQSNLVKHGLDFADAPKVFANVTLTLADTRFAYTELRFVTFGLLLDAVVAVAHTETVDTIRVISMRKAERYEREHFFANI